MSLDLTIRYTKQDKIRLNPHLSTWMKTHAYISKLNNSEDSIIELRRMLSIEINNNSREQIVERIRARLNAIRKQIEDQIIYTKLSEHVKPVKEKRIKKTKTKPKPPVVKSTAELLLDAGK